MEMWRRFNASIPIKLIIACIFFLAIVSQVSALSLQKGQLNRRDLFGTIAATSILTPKVGHAEESKVEESKGLLTTEEVAQLLHPVPTFTIVDKKGVPYMVVGEDAKVTGYFFTTYDEASRILELAKSSADKSIKEAKAEGKPKEEIGINVSPLFRSFSQLIPI